MKKYNLSTIMTNAWKLFRKYRCSYSINNKARNDGRKNVYTSGNLELD